MKKLLGVLLTLTMCLCMTGVVALADGDEDAVDYTSGVTLACNGEVVTETSDLYDYSDDGDQGTIFYVYMFLDELDTVTLDLLDASGNAAGDTVITVMDSVDYFVEVEDSGIAGTITGNTVTIDGIFGYAILYISSASLNVNTYVVIDYDCGDDNYEEDLTADAILYCNGVEVTDVTYVEEMNVTEKMYYLELTVGSTYELQFVDPTTGEILTMDPDDYNSEWYEEQDVYTINGDVLIVTPTEAGEDYFYGPASVMFNFVSAGAESGSSTGDSTSTSTDAATTAAAEVTTTSGDNTASETGDTSVWGYVLLLAGAAAVIAVLAKKHAEA